MADTAAKGAANGAPDGSTDKAAGLGGVNAAVRRRQQLLFASVAAIGLVAAVWWVVGAEGPGPAPAAGSDTVELDVSRLLNRNLSEREWIAASEANLNRLTERMEELERVAGRVAELEGKVQSLAAENARLKQDGLAMMDAYERALADVASGQGVSRQETAGQTGVVPELPPGAPPSSGEVLGGSRTQSPGMPFRQVPRSVAEGRVEPVSAGTRLPLTDRDRGPVDPEAFTPLAEVQILTFTGPKAPPAGAQVTPAAAPVVIDASPDYLPANSFAPARVVVGVDAAAGVASQSDPLPVLLRITGPARSVVQRGQVLSTRIEGCLINGAARGGLASEKVYVALQKLTCDQPGGRIAEAQVKGYLAYGGKAGVRGQVVSREGQLVSQAFMAGLVGGFGRGLAGSAGIGGIVVREDADSVGIPLGDVVRGGFGEGASTAADTVSQYLIERAEQYQPVIEMPTGIDVEVVFLEGVFVRAPE